jgi:hypothetical protein
MSGHERREFTRVSVPVEATVRLPGGISRHGMVREVSLTGVHIAFTPSVPDAEFYTIELRLQAGGSPVEVVAQATLIRADAEGAAFQFDALEGVESFEFLRNLVLMNADDPDTVESEVQGHIGIRRAGEGETTV